MGCDPSRYLWSVMRHFVGSRLYERKCSIASGNYSWNSAAFRTQLFIMTSWSQIISASRLGLTKLPNAVVEWSRFAVQVMLLIWQPNKRCSALFTRIMYHVYPAIRWELPSGQKISLCVFLATPRIFAWICHRWQISLHLIDLPVKTLLILFSSRYFEFQSVIKHMLIYIIYVCMYEIYMIYDKYVYVCMCLKKHTFTLIAFIYLCVCDIFPQLLWTYNS